MKIIPLALLFLLGVVAFQMSRLLPGWPQLLLLALILALLARQWLQTWWVCIFLLAFLWSAVMAHWVLYPALGRHQLNQSFSISGCITDIRSQSPEYVRFLLHSDQRSSVDEALPRRMLLSWYRPEMELQEGQCLSGVAKLKPPHGFASEGAFNREAWFYQRGIGAVGVIQSRFPLTLTVPSAGGLSSVYLQFREKITQGFQQILPKSDRLGLLLGLAAGDRNFIDASQWQVLQRTGTSHLLAISGLHVGAVAATCYALAFWLLRTAGFVCKRIAAQRIAVFAGVAGAGAYASLTGFAVPAQRAFIMLLVFSTMIWLRKKIPPSSLLASACLLVLLLDPRQVLGAGFWLSFIAVAIILIATHIVRLRNRYAGFLFLQWALSGSAFGLSLYYFGSASALMPLANLLAVPLVSLVILPLLLLTVSLLMLGLEWYAYPLLASDTLLRWMWFALQGLADSDWTIIQWQPSWFSVLTFHLGAALLLLFRNWRDRWLSVVLCGALLLPWQPRLKQSQFIVSVLDVGQGLAVIVQTANHVLVYDAGPRYASGFNTGEAVVLPYLRARNVQRVDTVVISHNDMDHRGGMDSLLSTLPVQRVYGSALSNDSALSGLRCIKGQHWQWDGVRFEFLHPQSGRTYSRNNGSCVLRISSQAGSILLTGDVERTIERSLVATEAGRVASTVLLVPHHGSLTSSDALFLQQVSPRLAINSAGFLNRYGFPSERLRRRYAHYRIPLLNTAELGTIEVFFATADRVPVVTSHRKRHDRYWNQVYQGLHERL